MNLEVAWDDIPINSTINWEFAVPLPRPLKTPPAGTYWAIELHSITWANNTNWREDALTAVAWCITTRKKLRTTPFLTYPGDDENLFFTDDLWIVGAGVHPECRQIQNQRTNHVKYTDDAGHGQLIIPETLYVQNQNHYWTQDEYDNIDPPWFSASLQYTFTTVSCSDFLQELASQLH